MISIVAPDGIGEVGPGTDLSEMIMDAVSEVGGLQDGDIVVITSKIVSKRENRYVSATDRPGAIDAETLRTVARRRSMAIVETAHGLTQAAAGVDNSNVDPDRVLLLPSDPDASARELCRELSERSGRRLGVIISDTAGRAWRVGQTDHAIGSAGVRVLDSYDGTVDAYGNELHVTAIAVADEIAAAAELVKRKTAGRPVAVLRGLGHLLLSSLGTDVSTDVDTDVDTDVENAKAADLVRPSSEDLFRYGVREAVIHAVLAAVGRVDRFEEVVRLEDRGEIDAAITAGLELDAGQRGLIDRMLDDAGVTFGTNPS